MTIKTMLSDLEDYGRIAICQSGLYARRAGMCYKGTDYKITAIPHGVFDSRIFIEGKGKSVAMAVEDAWKKLAKST